MVAGPAGISDEFISRRVHHGIGPPVQAPEVTTKVSSSRSAGAITKDCDDATATARRDQLRQQAGLTKAIDTLEEEVPLPWHWARRARNCAPAGVGAS